MISREDQLKEMRRSYDAVSKVCDAVILEGTGHTGVGSVVDLNNAQVAKRLNADMILVANGGLGSAYDDLALNYLMCQRWGVNVIGIILNKVNDTSLIIILMSLHQPWGLLNGMGVLIYIYMVNWFYLSHPLPGRTS